MKKSILNSIESLLIEKGFSNTKASKIAKACYPVFKIGQTNIQFTLKLDVEDGWVIRDKSGAKITFGELKGIISHVD